MKATREKISDLLSRFSICIHTLVLSSYHQVSIVCLLVFMSIISQWYDVDYVSCVSKYDRTSPREDYEKLCLNYGYTTASVLDTHRYYALFYRYTHWIFFGSFIIYGLPRFAIWIYEPVVLKKLDEDLEYHGFIDSLNDVNETNRKRLKKFFSFFKDYKGTQKRYYRLYLWIHVFALFINIIACFVIDAALNNRFWKMPFYMMQGTRNYHYFNDTMSLSFPHFVDCTIKPEMDIIVGREEHFGCHYPLMVWFEKYFLGLWFLQVLLLFVTIPFLFKTIIEMTYVKYCATYGKDIKVTMSDYLILETFKRRVPSYAFLDQLTKLNKEKQGALDD